jgi:Protein of unknown function (DUF2029).
MSTYLFFFALAIYVFTSARDMRLSCRSGPLKLIVLSGLSIAIIAWLSDGIPLSDFAKGYYPAGRLIWESPESLYSCDHGLHPSKLCFVNFPIVAVLFSPFSYLPLTLAEILFTIMGVCLAAVGVWRLCKGANSADGRLVAGLCILSGPLAYSIWLGNISHLLLPLMLAGFTAYSAGRDTKAGLIFSLLAFLKPFCALFLLYFLARRQWRLLFVMVSSALSAVIVSLLLFGVPVHEIFLKDFVLGFGAKPVVAFSVENYAAAIAHLTMPLNHLRSFAPIDELVWFKITRVSLSALTIFVVGAILDRAGKPSTAEAKLAELCIALCVVLLIAPVTWTHYLLLLLIPIAWVMMGEFKVHVRMSELVAVLVAAFLIILPVHQMIAPPGLRFIVQRLWNLHYVVGVCILLGALLKIRSKMPVAIEAQSGTKSAVPISGNGDYWALDNLFRVKRESRSGSIPSA